TSGDAPSSRLARTENRRNKRGRIYGTGYLGLPPDHFRKKSPGLIPDNHRHNSRRTTPSKSEIMNHNIACFEPLRPDSVSAVRMDHLTWVGRVLVLTSIRV